MKATSDWNSIWYSLINLPLFFFFFFLLSIHPIYKFIHLFYSLDIAITFLLPIDPDNKLLTSIARFSDFLFSRSVALILHSSVDTRYPRNPSGINVLFMSARKGTCVSFQVHILTLMRTLDIILYLYSSYAVIYYLYEI